MPISTQRIQNWDSGQQEQFARDDDDDTTTSYNKSNTNSKQQQQHLCENQMMTSSISCAPNQVKTPNRLAGPQAASDNTTTTTANHYSGPFELKANCRRTRATALQRTQTRPDGNSPNKSSRFSSLAWRLPAGHVIVVLICFITLSSLPHTQAKVENLYASTTPITQHLDSIDGERQNATATTTSVKPNDSIFVHFAKRFATGNELWQNIIGDCYAAPSFSCFQKNVYVYLNDALDASDVNVTQRLKFYRNHVDYEMEQVSKSTESAVSQDIDNEDGDDEEDGAANAIPHEGRAQHTADTVAETPIEEVTNSLYGKSIKFAMTHDVELKLPEVMFDGATFRISPRQIEGNGLIAKLELIPKQEVEARLAGKFIKKKIQKFLKNKLLLSFLALVLIIKIIKIKFFWLLPLVIGVGAAKKLLLKFLLFLFPALSHLFKLCSYYQQTYHSTKYHHHHHLINHHHTIVPSWHGSGEHSVPEIIYTDPPKGHISTYLHGAPIHETYGPPPKHEHYEGGWENSGPGLGSEYINDINRSAQLEENSNYFKPQPNDANVLHGWGLGTTQTPAATATQAAAQRKQQQQQQQQQQTAIKTQQHRPPLSPQQQQQLQQQLQQQHKPHSHSFNPFLNPDKQRVYHAGHMKTQAASNSVPHPVYTPPTRNINPIGNQGQQTAAAQIAYQYDATRLAKPNQQQLSPEVSEALRIQAEQRIIAQQQKILENQPFVQDGQPLMPKNYDPFYSPILTKIDKIVEQLGVTDDLCKERLVCSMYKDPSRYSPHSNFVSAELSRDTSELQPVTSTNEAVLRFYRLIQAARDGQDQRDCLLLYPQCNINTE